MKSITEYQLKEVLNNQGKKTWYHCNLVRKKEFISIHWYTEETYNSEERVEYYVRIPRSRFSSKRIQVIKQNVVFKRENWGGLIVNAQQSDKTIKRQLKKSEYPQEVLDVIELVRSYNLT